MTIDYKKYPANWKKEIRPRILLRDNNCCKLCGVENKRLIVRTEKGFLYWPDGMENEAWSLDGLKSVMIVLTIAHLDHDTTNNSDENLAALCQKCHLNYDRVFHKINAAKTIENKKLLQNLFE